MRKYPVSGSFADVLTDALGDILYTCDIDLTLEKNAGIKAIWESLPMREKTIRYDVMIKLIDITVRYNGMLLTTRISDCLRGDVEFGSLVSNKIKKQLGFEEE